MPKAAVKKWITIVVISLVSLLVLAALFWHIWGSYKQLQTRVFYIPETSVEHENGMVIEANGEWAVLWKQTGGSPPKVDFSKEFVVLMQSPKAIVFRTAWRRDLLDLASELQLMNNLVFLFEEDHEKSGPTTCAVIAERQWLYDCVRMSMATEYDPARCIAIDLQRTWWYSLKWHQELVYVTDTITPDAPPANEAGEE